MPILKEALIDNIKHTFLRRHHERFRDLSHGYFEVLSGFGRKQPFVDSCDELPLELTGESEGTRDLFGFVVHYDKMRRPNAKKAPRFLCGHVGNELDAKIFTVVR